MWRNENVYLHIYFHKKIVFKEASSVHLPRILGCIHRFMTAGWCSHASSGWTYLYQVAAACPLSPVLWGGPVVFPVHDAASLWLFLPSSSLGKCILHFILCWWSWNWVLPNNMTSELEEPYLELERMFTIKIFTNFLKTFLQSGYDSCWSWRWETIGPEPVSSEQQGLVLYAKVFISFHGGCWNSGSRNPAFNVSLGTPVYYGLLLVVLCLGNDSNSALPILWIGVKGCMYYYRV